MFGKAISYGSVWDFAADESIVESQRWILSTMQSYGQEDVCDAYQDTFLQLAHYEGGRKPQHLKAYVFRTANNIAISMLRRKIAERNRLSRPVTTTSVCSPVKEIDSKYLQETLRSHIAQLPEHLRNVITLRDLAELSYSQISRILGISAATARVYRCKAIQLLSVWMGREE